jgi:DNA-directed RNA polymerase subunit K/omega
MAKTFETYQYVNPIVVRMKESEKGVIYKSVVAMGMRARQINDYIKFELNERLADVIDLNAETDVANYDQIAISREFDNIPKPTFIAMREIMDDKLRIEERSEISED